jgi:hypothetical protein
LANGARADSNVLDNTTTKFDAVEIAVTLKSGPTGVTAGGTIKLGIIKSVDGGVTYETRINDYLATLSGTLASAAGYTLSGFLTTVPEFLKVCIINNTGTAFDTSGANFHCDITGIYYQTNESPMTTTQVAVTSTQVQIAAVDVGRQAVIVYNQGSVPVYIGATGVTNTTGLLVPFSSTPLTLPNQRNTALYAICASATSTTLGVMTY